MNTAFINRGRGSLWRYALFAGFLLLLWRPSLWGDGGSYFAYDRSLVLDRDLHFENEYQSIPYWPDFSPPTATGYIGNPFAVGSAVLNLPFYLAGHQAAMILQALTGEFYVDGFSLPYVAAYCAGTLFWGVAGLLLLRIVLSRAGYQEGHRWVIGTTVLGTFVLYYLVIHTSHSHAASFFTTALFLWVWLSKTSDRDRWYWLTLGTVVGLSTIVRWQNGLLILCPILEFFLAGGIPWRSMSRTTLMKCTAHVLFFLLGFLVCASVQLAVWRVLYQEWIHPEQQSGFFITDIITISKQIFLIFFSWNRGLLTWMPVWGLGLAGVFLWARRVPRFGLPILVFMILQILTNAANNQWDAAGGFAGRRFCQSAPFIALGLAELWSIAESARSKLLLKSALVLSCFWTLLLFGFQFQPVKANELGFFSFLSAVPGAALRLPADALQESFAGKALWALASHHLHVSQMLVITGFLFILLVILFLLRTLIYRFGNSDIVSLRGLGIACAVVFPLMALLFYSTDWFCRPIFYLPLHSLRTEDPFSPRYARVGSAGEPEGEKENFILDEDRVIERTVLQPIPCESLTVIASLLCCDSPGLVATIQIRDGTQQYKKEIHYPQDIILPTDIERLYQSRALPLLDIVAARRDEGMGQMKGYRRLEMVFPIPIRPESVKIASVGNPTLEIKGIYLRPSYDGPLPENQQACTFIDISKQSNPPSGPVMALPPFLREWGDRPQWIGQPPFWLRSMEEALPISTSSRPAGWSTEIPLSPPQSLMKISLLAASHSGKVHGDLPLARIVANHVDGSTGEWRLLANRDVPDLLHKGYFNKPIIQGPDGSTLVCIQLPFQQWRSPVRSLRFDKIGNDPRGLVIFALTGHLYHAHLPIGDYVPLDLSPGGNTPNAGWLGAGEVSTWQGVPFVIPEINRRVVYSTYGGDHTFGRFPVPGLEYESVSILYVPRIIWKENPAKPVGRILLINEDNKEIKRELIIGRDVSRDVNDLSHPSSVVRKDSNGNAALLAVTIPIPKAFGRLQEIRIEDVNGPQMSGVEIHAMTAQLKSR